MCEMKNDWYWSDVTIDVDSAVADIEMFTARTEMTYPPALKKSRSGTVFYFTYEICYSFLM